MNSGSNLVSTISLVSRIEETLPIILWRWGRNRAPAYNAIAVRTVVAFFLDIPKTKRVQLKCVGHDIGCGLVFIVFRIPVIFSWVEPKTKHRALFQSSLQGLTEKGWTCIACRESSKEREIVIVMSMKNTTGKKYRSESTQIVQLAYRTGPFFESASIDQTGKEWLHHFAWWMYHNIAFIFMTEQFNKIQRRSSEYRPWSIGLDQ